MRCALHQALTGIDNQTIDISRVLWAVLTLGYVVQSAIATWRGAPWDPVAWSAGAAALLAGGSAGVVIKRSTEPGQG